MGLRYRKYARHLPGHPDILFPTERVVVFVDGDYWHARFLVDGGATALRRKLAGMPLNSRAYWRVKFTRRVDKDRSVTVALRKDGWTVLRFWEGDIKSNLYPAARKIAAAVARRRLLALGNVRKKR